MEVAWRAFSRLNFANNSSFDEAVVDKMQEAKVRMRTHWSNCI